MNDDRIIFNMDLPTTKVCPKCHREKSMGEFYAYSKRTDKHAADCKECVKAASHARYVAKRQKHLEQNRRDFVPVTINRTTAIVHLTRGLHAVIDVEDWNRVGAGKKKWNAAPAGYSTVKFQAVSTHKGRSVYIQNYILSAPPGDQIDHADRNPLNNRRQNLRPATLSQNSANRLRSFRYARGVRKQKNGRFQAMIRVKGKSIALGTFDSVAEAGEAYDAAARKHYGKFAILNSELSCVA